ncbi:MAG TPA: extradiol ring-cleavage dioxygenase [Chloroflexota bacterium]|nr:extradiol ring-cleavage dioxygenase [Chloroflexota bacterium]
MAEIAGAFATPHMPGSPGQARENPQSETAQLFGAVRSHIAEVDPDVLVVFDTDHFATFFYSNMPTFAVGVAGETAGPGTDDWPGLFCYYPEIPLHEELGRHVHASGINSGFDLSQTQEFEIDHSIVVPLHFLNDEGGKMKRPIVPLWVNGIAPPLPLAKRCYALGGMVREAIASWPSNLRVGIVASGAISGDIGGPKAIDGQPFAWPDESWVVNVVNRMRNGEIDELLNEATADRLRAAGNVSGEMLNWIALLGAVGGRKPRFLEPQLKGGNAYGAWRWD